MSYDIRRVLEAVDRIEDKLNASKNPNMTNNSFYEQFTIEYISDMDSLNLVERKIVNHGNLYPDYRNQLVLKKLLLLYIYTALYIKFKKIFLCYLGL